jgi:hypothetical protein
MIKPDIETLFLVNAVLTANLLICKTSDRNVSAETLTPRVLHLSSLLYR